jgi:hypothetical protein
VVSVSEKSPKRTWTVDHPGGSYRYSGTRSWKGKEPTLSHRQNMKRVGCLLGSAGDHGIGSRGRGLKGGANSRKPFFGVSGVERNGVLALKSLKL